MKVRELIDRLGDYSPEAEVRILLQPRYRCSRRWVAWSPRARSASTRAATSATSPRWLYLLEGAQIGCGRAVAWEAAK